MTTSKERQAVENAKRGQRRQSEVNPQSSELPSGAMNDNLIALSVDMKRNIKKVIVHNAIAMAMQDFAAGDYGDIEDELFAQFSGEMLSPLEAQYQALLEGRTLKEITLQPVLPASCGEPITSSSSIS
ncbi:MAG: hypothetical protein HWQ38_09785 [Nostoc sp. NMS7]|uniref:hypothetical protein n=1 Tax=Nostoc sp. NMS7 TaxID=2815391 RepID=UPI0025E6A223|nr:hypothetical protein [Nostoc sp. NMS7]MBN3946760.1 hypothetical protein [Nostoc sp. NMS7]